MKPPRPHRHATGLALGAVSVLALGLAAGALLVRVPPPDDVAGTVTDPLAPVVERGLDDARTVPVSLDVTAAQPLVTTRGGRVTASSCVPGARVRSGQTPFSVDGVPLLALATANPLWRDLTPGDRGADVDALQAALDVSPRTGVVDAAMLAALRELAAPTVHDDRVDHTAVLWLPDDEATVDTCDAPVGALVGEGQTLATLPPRLVAARVPAPAADALPGDRTLVVDDVTLPLDDGAVTDPDALAALAATPTYRAAVVEQTGIQLTAQWRLVDPVSTAVVPPSAVVTGPAGACVLDEHGVAHAVTVVGSQLGQTFVRVDGDAPGRVRTAPGRAACS